MLFKGKVVVVTGGAQGIGKYGHVDVLVNKRPDVKRPLLAP